VALEIQRAHEKMVKSTMLIIQFNTIEEATQRRDDRGKGVRASKSAARDKLRVKRVLTEPQRQEVLSLLAGRVIRKGQARHEWMSEVWLELEHPTITIATKEGRKGKHGGANLSLAVRVEKAVQRAQYVMKASAADSKSYLSIQDLTE